MHNLTWEDDAYYSITYKNQNLWAYHRKSALELMRYIESIDRNVKDYRWSNFLLHIPSVFKKQSARRLSENRSRSEGKLI